MAVDATPETFESLVAEGSVLVDFWGPRCQPCIALMPAVEALEERYDGQLKLVKVNAPDNRLVCRDLRVMGLPTYVLYRDGAEIERLTGDPSRADIEAAVSRLVEGGEWMELRGKKVIALGERDGVPGNAIADCMRSAGAEIVLAETECFVWTAAGAMDPENQDRIKALVDRVGADGLVVVLGAADPEALEVAAETVTAGDPSYVGPLAGVSLGLPVVHIFEDEVKEQIDPAVYEEQVGLLELALDTEAVKETMRKARGAWRRTS